MNKGLITINDSENKWVSKDGSVVLLTIYERGDFKYYLDQDLNVWSADLVDEKDYSARVKDEDLEPTPLNMTLADFLAEGE